MTNDQYIVHDLFIRMLIKRAQGRSRLGFKNFKKRFFVLTNKGLSYSKDKTKATLGHIPVCDILGAESLGEDSFHLKLVRAFTTQQGYGALGLKPDSSKLYKTAD